MANEWLKLHTVYNITSLAILNIRLYRTSSKNTTFPPVNVLYSLKIAEKDMTMLIFLHTCIHTHANKQ